jgi:ribosomal protein L12E/L44/L45/RPP1/RPP2
MKYLAAYLLLSLHHANPTKEEIKAVFGSVGIVAEEERLDALFKALEGKDINQVQTPSPEPATNPDLARGGPIPYLSQI